MTWMDQYDTLAKPSRTPSPPTINLIWTVLYSVIRISFGFVFTQTYHRKVSTTVALPFAVNLVANLLYMPIIAGLRSVPLAADFVIAWATII